MGGVDGHDQMLHQYIGDRRSAKFWKKLTFNLLSRMILNSYILYKQNTTNPMTRLKFLVTLVDSLSAEWFDFKEQRHPIPDTDVSDDENQGGGDAGILPSFFEKLPNKKERNCCVCSAASTRLGGKRKKSSYICKKYTRAPDDGTWADAHAKTPGIKGVIQVVRNSYSTRSAEKNDKSLT
ncbi:hypothetical protein J6590_085347 [Homalodisca vitripennis]|nr:hypothetical protein J6590_085347 [Homalodisca vitripennis]